MAGNHFILHRPADESNKDTVSTVGQLEFVSKELKQVVCKQIDKLPVTNFMSVVSWYWPTNLCCSRSVYSSGSFNWNSTSIWSVI